MKGLFIGMFIFMFAMAGVSYIFYLLIHSLDAAILLTFFIFFGSIVKVLFFED